MFLANITILLSLFSNEVKVKELPLEWCRSNNVVARYFSDSFSVEVGGDIFRNKDVGVCKETKKGKVSSKIQASSLVHELGHHFWFTRLSSSEKNTWIKLNSLCSSSSCFVSSYARTNYKEDFSETFTAMYLGQYSNSNKHIKAKFEFMKKLVEKYN